MRMTTSWNQMNLVYSVQFSIRFPIDISYSVYFWVIYDVFTRNYEIGHRPNGLVVTASSLYLIHLILTISTRFSISFLFSRCFNSICFCIRSNKNRTRNRNRIRNFWRKKYWQMFVQTIENYRKCWLRLMSIWIYHSISNNKRQMMKRQTTAFFVLRVVVVREHIKKKQDVLINVSLRQRVLVRTLFTKSFQFIPFHSIRESFRTYLSAVCTSRADIDFYFVWI